MSGIHCADCGDFLEGEGLIVGDVLECENCGCELEVVSETPFRALVLAEEK